MRLPAALRLGLLVVAACCLCSDPAWAQTPTPTPQCSPVYWSSDCSTTGSYAWDSDCWRCTSGNGSAVVGLRPRRPDISCAFDHFAAGSGQAVVVTGSVGMACRTLEPLDDRTSWVGTVNLAPGVETLTLGAFGTLAALQHPLRACADNLTICHDDADCVVAGVPCSNGFATDPTGTWTLRFTETIGQPVLAANTGDSHLRNVIFDPASAAWQLRGFHAYGDLTVTGAALDNNANHDVRVLADGAVACDGVTLTSSTNFITHMQPQNAMTCAGATMDHVTGESGYALPIFAVSGSTDAGNNTNVCFNAGCPAGTYTATPAPTETPTIPHCAGVVCNDSGTCDAATCLDLNNTGFPAVSYADVPTMQAAVDAALGAGKVTVQNVNTTDCNPSGDLTGVCPAVAATETPTVTPTATPTGPTPTPGLTPGCCALAGQLVPPATCLDNLWFAGHPEFAISAVSSLAECQAATITLFGVDRATAFNAVNCVDGTAPERVDGRCGPPLPTPTTGPTPPAYPQSWQEWMDFPKPTPPSSAFHQPGRL